MDDLLELDKRRPSGVNALPEGVGAIATPLRWEVWAKELRDFPDREFARYIVDGIRHGFRIGFDYSSRSCSSASRNMSAKQHPQPIRDYLAKELEAGRVIGPLGRDASGLNVQVSRFGVIPKPHQPGKWRLITDLSSPGGVSVIDGVDPRLCSVNYASVDDAVEVIVRLGRDARLAKFDLESAYRLVPVWPEDRLLLGMRWEGATYVDGALPFGLRSAPKLFTAMADALLWIMGQHGVREAMHYLDDFLVLGPAGSEECGEAVSTSMQLCQSLGVPIAPHKTEGPSTTLSFLGILIDTEDMVLRLPSDKLARLRAAISEWKGRRSCHKQQLLSLIGQLQHACRVVRAGRTFLRRMIDLSTVVKKLHHQIRLNRAFQSDLLWWDTFLEVWNGVSVFASLLQGPPAGVLTSDASGGWGCGAFTSKGEWFQLQWPESWASVHITVKELAPIVVACAIWGPGWRGKTVRCLCDNAAVVAILRSGTAKHPLVMHLMRCLSFFVAFYQLYLDARHLPGTCNEAADALSRDNLPFFMQLNPGAQSMATTIPDSLVHNLLHTTPDWSSQSWMAELLSILHKV